MSGGHWNYMSTKLKERGQALKDMFDFLAAVEHELDWGICCDTCLDCAKQRLGEAMIFFFDGNAAGAIAMVRDQGQNQCPRCASEDRTR